MDLTSLLLVLVPLFVIVDPFASIGLFLGLTVEHDRKGRRKIAIKASVFAAAVLVLFAVAGDAMLSYLGVELYALQTAGGLLLTMIGLNMLREGREIPRKEIQIPTGGHHLPGEEPGDPSFVPLGLPMLAGPGAISLVIVQSTASGLGVVTVSIAIVMVAAALLLMVAGRMQKHLGDDSSRVITRIMGILTVAFAAQYVFDGVAGWLDTVDTSSWFPQAVNGTAP